MKDYKLKFRYIVLGLLKINILFTSIYLILYWILILKLDLNINKKIVELCFPFILSISAVLLFRPNVKLLVLENNRMSGAYYMLALVSILSSCIFGGEKLYIINSKTSHLEQISDFDFENQTAFYTIKNFNLAHNYLYHTSKIDYEISRSSGNQSYNLYFAIPPVDSMASFTEIPKVWFTKKYTIRFDDINNPLTRREIFNFFKNSERDFVSDSFKDYYCFKRLTESDYKRQVINTINSITGNSLPDDAIILTPLEDNPYNKNDSLLPFLLSFFIPLIILSCMIIGPKYSSIKRIKNHSL